MRSRPSGVSERRQILLQTDKRTDRQNELTLLIKVKCKLKTTPIVFLPFASLTPVSVMPDQDFDLSP